MKRRVMPLCCAVCGGRHFQEECRVGEREGPERPRLPLATPSHNGTYRGDVPVRVIPAGLSGEAPNGKVAFFGVWKDKSERGRRTQTRMALRRTHCKRGHEFSADNTYYFAARKGEEKQYPRCRQCALDRDKARNERRKQERANAPKETMPRLRR